MRFRAIIDSFLLLCIFGAWNAQAETSSGLTSIALPGIAEKPALGAMLGITHRFDNPYLVDKISANLMYYPGIQLIDPSRIEIEGESAVLKRGNNLDFDEKRAHLLVISPRATSCFWRETICFNVSPLSMPIFTASQQHKVYVSPLAGIQIQQRWFGAQWFVSYETSLLYDQSAWALGAAF